MSKKIFIIAGEASGDLHGSFLARALKEAQADIRLFGLGGEKMEKAGVEIFFNSPELAVIGFIEVLKNLKKFKEVFNLLTVKLKEIRPDMVILIDYPGFNLRLAKVVKALNIKLFYYISPQIWAWGQNRIKLIQRYIDKMLVVFKFEEDFYKQFNVTAEFIGHPLMDVLHDYELTCKQMPVLPAEAKKGWKIALLPGSRENEVKNILPLMLKTAEIIQRRPENCQFLLAKSGTVKKETYSAITKKFNLNLICFDDKTYDCLSESDFVFVCSGTATLETAIFLKPMAIIYKTSFLTYFMIKTLIKVPHIGLVNLIADQKIAPEFIQFNTQAKKMADYALMVLGNNSLRENIRQKLSEVRKKLGPPGTNKRAAKIILENL